MTHRFSLFIVCLFINLAFLSNSHANLLGAEISGNLGTYRFSMFHTDSGNRIIGEGSEYSVYDGVLNYELDISADGIDLIVTNIAYPGLNVGWDAFFNFTIHSWGSGDWEIVDITGYRSEYLDFTSNSISTNLDIPGATPGVQIYHWDVVTRQISVTESASLLLLLAGLSGLIFSSRGSVIKG